MSANSPRHCLNGRLLTARLSPLPLPSLSLSLGASQVLLGGSSRQLSALFKPLPQRSKLEACVHRFKLQTPQGPPGRPRAVTSPSPPPEALPEVQKDVITTRATGSKVRHTAQPLICCVTLNKLLNLSEFHLASCKKKSIIIYRVVVIT